MIFSYSNTFWNNIKDILHDFINIKLKINITWNFIIHFVAHGVNRKILSSIRHIKKLPYVYCNFVFIRSWGIYQITFAAAIVHAKNTVRS